MGMQVTKILEGDLDKKTRTIQVKLIQKENGSISFSKVLE